jgi:hypothetical protein
MRCILPILLTTGAALAQGIGTPTDSPSEQLSASLHGVVKEEATGAFLERVTIQVGQLTGTLTHDNGSYVVGHITPGRYHVTASRNDVEPVTQIVTIGPGDDVSLDFAVPGSPSISGRVLDQNKEKVAEAKVWLISSEYRSGVLRRVTAVRETEEDGAFSFDTGLLAGRAYYLLAEPPAADHVGEAEQPTYYGEAVSFETAVPLILRPAEHREQVDIRLQQHSTYCVDGKAEAGGQPAVLPLKIQESVLAGTNIVRAEAKSTAPDGAFRVCGLTPGSYRIWAAESPKLGGFADFVIADADVRDVLLPVDAVNLTLDLKWEGDAPPEGPKIPVSIAKIGNSWVGFSEEGEQVALPQQLLKALQGTEAGEGAQNSFTTTDASRRAAESLRPREVRLQLAGAGSDDDADMRSDVPFEGRFGRQLSAGDYAVDAHISGSYVKRITFDNVNVPDRVLHLVGGVASTLGIVFAHDGGYIDFTVKDKDGNPVPEARVVFLPADVTDAALASRWMQSERSDGGGMCSSETLAPGKYRALALTRPPRQTPEEMEKLLQALRSSPVIELAPKTTVKAELVLSFI